jgi:hypothetical protein
MKKDDHLIFEAFKNRLPGAGPDDALKNTGPGENEEYDAEDTPYASGQVGGRGEEYGTGEVKLLLLRDEKFDCYLNGTVQSVRFFRGTVFNCEPYDGEFYNCESDEYGTIAITPDAHLKILDAPAGSTNTEDEDAEGRPGMQTYIYLDLYTGKTSIIPSREFQDAIDGLEKVRGKMTVYKGEEYMVLVVPAGTTITEDAENEPHGYPQGMTAIQNTVLNELKKRGFVLTKISHIDKERDKYPTVFMVRSQGPMHKVAEIDGMGMINGDHFKHYIDYLDSYVDPETVYEDPG